MKRLLLSAALGASLLFSFAGTVFAHAAATTCGAIVITNTPTNEPGQIWNGTHASPGTQVSGPDQNGTYTVAAGPYFVIWPLWDQNGAAAGNGTNWQDLTVAACPVPTPTPAPPTVTWTDCIAPDGFGSVTISGLTTGSVTIEAVPYGPFQILNSGVPFTAHQVTWPIDGSTSLAPGNYVWKYPDLDHTGGLFTIGPCPTPTIPTIPCTPANNCFTPPPATPSPSPVVTPTPTVTPTPVVTPTPTSSNPIVTPVPTPAPPQPTPPVTSTVASVTSTNGSSDVLFLIGLGLLAAGVFVFRVPLTKRLR